MSIEPSPFLPQTTIAIEKVKIAARAAHPSWKIISFKSYPHNIAELQCFLSTSNTKLIFQKYNKNK